MKKASNSDGFIALISAVLITASLLVAVVTLSLSSFYGRFNILDSELKEQSQALAESCVHVALLELFNNINYSGNATSTIGSEECYIGAVTTNAGNKIFRTKGIYKHYYTHLEITADMSTLDIVSWRELAGP